MIKLLVPIVLLLGAIGGVVISDHPLPPSSYTFAQTTDLFTLDPQRVSYQQDIRMSFALFEGLVRWDNETYEILPGVAERWEVSDDGLVYTFHLRTDARWSTGEPVTARDFIYSWERALRPDTAADYTQMLFHIAGAEDYFNWRSEALSMYSALPDFERSIDAALGLRARSLERFRRSVGLAAPDPYTLRVVLRSPTPYFLDLVAFPTYAPVHEATVERWTSIDPDSGRIEQRHGWTKPDHIVTNGPYLLKRWRFKRDARLERNPHYWNQDAIRSESVTMLIVSDANTAQLAFQTGAVDWVEDVIVDYLPEMLAQQDRGERNDLHKAPAFGTYFWSFNCRPTLPGGRDNPFADPGVRRAFALATNKRDIVEKVRRQGEPVSDTFVPPGSVVGYDADRSLAGLSFDPERAREELERAGWVDRNGDGVPDNEAGAPFPVVELLYSTNSYHGEIAQAMSVMWEKALGVRTRVVPKESKIYKDDLKTGDYMIARGGWFGDYGDPTTFLNVHRTGDGNNDRGYSDPVFDELMARSDAELDPDERMRILAEAEKRTITETMPILPLYTYVRYYQFDPERFRGVSMHPRLMQYLYELERIE